MRIAFLEDRAMTERAQITALRCATTIVLAFAVPVWLAAIPIIALSLAAAISVSQHPEQTRRALDVLRALLTPPGPPPTPQSIDPATELPPIPPPTAYDSRHHP